jgi:hypothetical protein
LNGEQPGIFDGSDDTLVVADPGGLPEADEEVEAQDVDDHDVDAEDGDGGDDSCGDP